MKTTLILLVALLGTASAYCPNACSNHGTCSGKHDMCTCEAGFQGPDCSLRTCLYGRAWLTTAKGDLNYDGDTDDATCYRNDIAFKSSAVGYVTSQETGEGGDWERWPSYFADNKDEGHFYMECSNRGTCDRKTGQCVCFDGYTGEACRRTVCPTTNNQDCSGHGTCETVADLVSANTAISEVYALWDGEMSRACKCDPGYSGIHCADRLCPKGDDPLTAALYNSQTADVDQKNEVQFLEIYANEPADHSAATNAAAIAGTFQLEYTDYFGEKWVTDPVSVSPYYKLVDDSAVATIETAVEDALIGLPNDVISDVEVTAYPCSTVDAGDVTSTDCTGFTAGFHVCDGFTNFFYCDGTATTVGNVGSGTFSALTAKTCNLVDKLNCVRLKVSFTHTPGDLTTMNVDTAEVTVNSKTHFQDSTTGIGAFEHPTVTLTPSGTTWSYKEGSVGGTAVTSVTCTTTCETTSGSTTLTAEASDALSTNSLVVPNAVVHLTCDTLDIGRYTVDSVTSDTVIDFKEKISATCAAGTALTITVVTSFFNVGFDFRHVLAAGDRLDLAGDAEIEAVQWDGTNGQILMKWHDTSSTVEFLGTSTGSIIQTETATTEKSECSDRGVCDSSTGECMCFLGYTGNACQEQNALAV